MLKIKDLLRILKELLKTLIETQKQINESLKEIKEDLKPQIDTIRINGDKLSTCSITVDRLDNYIDTNIYTKEQTLETFNKEYDYRQEYEKCLIENGELLCFIENYCKYEDKYEVLKIFQAIDEEYEIKKRKAKKVEE